MQTEEGGSDGLHSQDTTCESQLRDSCAFQRSWDQYPTLLKSPLRTTRRGVDAEARGHGCVECAPFAALLQRTSCSGPARGISLGVCIDVGIHVAGECFSVSRSFTLVVGLCLRLVVAKLHEAWRFAPGWQF